MKKPLDYQRMDLRQRRHFLKLLATVLASPLVTPSMRFGVYDILLGEAQAQTIDTGTPTNFIEISLRDQFDLLHAIVPPGIATRANLRTGSENRVALYENPNNLKRAGNNFFLTSEGSSLEPHVGDIAVIETCETAIGYIHAHEAANCLRSPGRTHQAGGGKMEMWLEDAQYSQIFLSGDPGGNDYLYSRTPTPAILHNYHQRKLDSNLRRGVNYKGSGRGDNKHLTYHFAANLADAQLQRFTNTSTFLSSFSNVQTTPTLLAQHRDLITQLLSKVDSNFLNRIKYEKSVASNHITQLTNLNKNLSQQARTLNLELDEAERDYWISQTDFIGSSTAQGSKAAIGEQCAYAAKLISSGIIRTIALEFTHGDIHGGRTETQMRAQGAQFAQPLAKLIQALKNSGVWNNTVIAVYTTDGGREMINVENQDDGNIGNRKNSVVIAGGRIKGGYYGDIRITGDNGSSYTFTHYNPDSATGLPSANPGRTSGASVWKSVAKAAGIPASLYNSYVDVQGEPELNFLLKG